MKFRVPDIVLGVFLTVAVFATGMLFGSSYYAGPAAKNQSQHTETAAQSGDASKPLAEGRANDGHAKQHKEEKSEFWSAKLTDWLLAVFTFFLVAFTYRLWKSTEKLWLAGEKQIAVAQDSVDAAMFSAEAAGRSAGAAERSSTSDRAWLFVKITSRGVITRNGSSGFLVRAEYQVENFGKTPATITKLDTHLFWNIGSGPEPDPISDTASREDWTSILCDKDTHAILPSGPISRHSPNSQTVIPANHFVLRAQQILNVEGTFCFLRTLDIPEDAPRQFHSSCRIRAPDGTISTVLCGDFWLYVLMKYKDIYGFDRETSYFTKIFSTNVAQPVEQRHQKYNYWN
jgi:hypothetical protein